MLIGSTWAVVQKTFLSVQKSVMNVWVNEIGLNWNVPRVDFGFVNCCCSEETPGEAENEQKEATNVCSIMLSTGHKSRCSMLSLSPATRPCTGRRSKQSGSCLPPPSPCRWSQSGPHDEYPGEGGVKKFRIHSEYGKKNKKYPKGNNLGEKECFIPVNSRRFLGNSSLWPLS